MSPSCLGEKRQTCKSEENSLGLFLRECWPNVALKLSVSSRCTLACWRTGWRERREGGGREREREKLQCNLVNTNTVKCNCLGDIKNEDISARHTEEVSGLDYNYSGRVNTICHFILPILPAPPPSSISKICIPCSDKQTRTRYILYVPWTFLAAVK